MIAFSELLEWKLMEVVVSCILTVTASLPATDRPNRHHPHFHFHSQCQLHFHVHSLFYVHSYITPPPPPTTAPPPTTTTTAVQ